MATVIFDFDATIISCEALESLIKKKLKGKPDLINEVVATTEAGVRGHITFAESLRKRLNIAAPTKYDAIDFGEKAHQWLTPGMDELIYDLLQQEISVWIVSGAPKEMVIPLGKQLQIPEENIQAVELLWDANGQFQGIDPEDPHSISKVKGVKDLKGNWTSPVIGVGDGASDYALYQQNLVDDFILFTKHIRCEEILAQGALESPDVPHLQKQLKELIKKHVTS